MLTQNYLIVKDLYTLSSIFFIKGVADANHICDPYIAEMLCEKQDGYTSLITLNDSAEEEWTVEDYMDVMVYPAASQKNLHNIRNFMLYVASKKMKTAICYLLNYMYRQGCDRAVIYNGNQPEKMLQDGTIGTSRFLGPKGYMTIHAWHDELKKNVVLIKNKQESPEIMNTLSEYMSIAIKDKKESEERLELYNERRAFILQGGDFSSK